MSSGIDEMEAEVDVGGNAEGKAGLQDFHKDYENFARIAKISQGLRKFRKDCENFATIAKISQSLRKFHYAQFFAKLAKFRYHSKSYCA